MEQVRVRLPVGPQKLYRVLKEYVLQISHFVREGAVATSFGRNPDPTIDIIQRIAKAFGVSVENLLAK